MKTERAAALPSPYPPATASASSKDGGAEALIADTCRLQAAIGRAVRRCRRSQGLTVAGLAVLAARSRGMLSKIENGLVAPSIDTLSVLARALNVPVAAFFTEAPAAGATFLPAGRELPMRRRGRRAGQACRLVGHAPGNGDPVELHMITLSQPGDAFPHFKHASAAVLHMLEGEMGYRHGEDVYLLRAGDTLSFDAAASHGPVAPVARPLRCLAVLSCGRD